ncbi:MAG: hypothetical protein AMDU5_GPLC00004G0283 [Thermoplasmatales archaeon Gpl]|jgi:uncharacterized membrane protein|nr:MAG: hypothetical protein AMDU5_GPLC00004G0283 [Thermoplasmatales archaeon Gpl]
MNHSGKNMGMQNMHSESSSEKEIDDVFRPAMIILSERYAKGELGREEYLKMRQDILPGNKA